MRGDSALGFTHGAGLEWRLPWLRVPSAVGQGRVSVLSSSPS